MYRCNICNQIYPDYYANCPYGCKLTSVRFEPYGHVSTALPNSYSKQLLEEENMCEKKEPTTKWGLRIGTDSNNKYSVEFNKKIANEYSGYMQSHDNILRTFETFEDALKFANDTHKNLSK